ncbi:MAG: hypothetical protein MAG451_02390 [Anaerolineales bacterium]|nr:hypothetical protein [Anaerolineales bacterium]
MSVNGVDAVLAGPSPHAAADGLVVSVWPLVFRVPAADGEVVHGALAGRRHPLGSRLSQCAQQHVGDALRGFDVATGHGGWRARIHQRALRRDDGERLQTAAIGRNIQTDERPEYVVGGRESNGVDGVDAALALGRRAGEVDGGFVAGDGNGDGDLGRLGVDAVVVHLIAEGVGAVGQVGDEAPRHAFGVAEEAGHVMLDVVLPVLADEFLHALGAFAVGRHLGAQVAGALFRRADVGEEQVQQALVEVAGFGQFQWRDDDAFLIQLLGQRHRARRHATDIRVVSAIGTETEKLLL